MSELNAVRQLSAHDFATLGITDIAFVKPVLSNGSEVFEIHTADGELVADMPSWESAVALIHENEMEAARIH